MKSWPFPPLKRILHHILELLLFLSILPDQILCDPNTIFKVTFLLNNFVPLWTINKLANYRSWLIIASCSRSMGVFNFWLQIKLVCYYTVDFLQAILARRFWNVVKTEIVFAWITLDGQQTFIHLSDLRGMVLNRAFYFIDFASCIMKFSLKLLETLVEGRKLFRKLLQGRLIRLNLF